MKNIIKRVLTYLAHRQTLKNPSKRNKQQFELAYKGLQERGF